MYMIGILLRSMYQWYEYKTDNHEEEPCEDLIWTHDESTIDTGRIDPSFRKCSNIFSEPDKESNEWKPKSEIHRVVLFSGFEVYPGSTKSEKYSYEYDIPEVPDKVMCEKVYIDRERDEDRIYLFRIVLESKIKYSPDSRDIAPNGWVHESCKEGNPQNPYWELTRILPGSDRWMGLEYLHNCRDHMEYHDNPHLTPRLESSYDEKYLEYDRWYEEEIISIEDVIKGIIVFRHYEKYDEVEPENTRICLLRDESEEVAEEYFHIIFWVFW